MKEKKRSNVECGRSGVAICHASNMIRGGVFLARPIFRVFVIQIDGFVLLEKSMPH